LQRPQRVVITQAFTNTNGTTKNELHY